MPYTPLDQTRVHWTPDGRPYWLSMDGTQKHFIPPMVAAQYRDDPRMLQWAQSQGFALQRDEQGGITGMDIAKGAGAGGNRPLDFRTGRQWDTKEGRYDTDFDWGDVVTILASVPIGAGVAAAASGGGGGAAGGAAFDAAPAASSAQGAANMAALGSLGGDALGVPVGTAAIGAPAGGAPTALGGVKPPKDTVATASTLDKLKDALMSNEGMAGIGALVTSLMAGDGTNDETKALNQNALRQQAITEARMRRVDPLHEAVTQLAFGRLPVSSRQGIDLPRVALPR